MKHTSNKRNSSGRVKSRKAKSKPSGPRIGKSRADKANNQRNRILSKAKRGNTIITPDGHCIRLPKE